ncbi:MAG: patatin-like phospholipase family protein [Cyanobacteria bacterium J06638_22]
MALWDPSDIRKREKLFLSEDERAAIQAKLPLTETGEYFADAVFEGGGVKGTAFLGALRCFSEVGVQWKRVAGTSAGAITAALVVADFPIEDLERIIGQLDYENQILQEKTSPFIFNRSPEDDLDSPQWMIPNLLLVGQLGQYSTDPFKQWIAQVLSDRQINTFQDIIRQRQGRALKVVISDISLRKMVVLPDDLHKVYPNYVRKTVDFEVAEAVRLSMSIPFFFNPGKLADSTIVDGGILSNFPLWIYDVTTHHRPPRWPTFGFRISEDLSGRHSVNNAVDLLTGMLDTALIASDRYHLQRYEQERVIEIDTSQVTATEFNFTNEKKDDLYRNGYLATKDFLLKHWSWERHLQTRGYDSSKTSTAVSVNPQ